MSAPDPAEALRAVQPAASTLDGEQLRAVFACMAVGMLVVDVHGLVIDANPAAEALLGLPRVEIIGRSVTDPRWHAVDLDGQPLAPSRHPAMQALRSGMAVQNCEIGVGLIGGGRRWLTVNSVPLLTAGETTGAVSSFVDVGKRRSLESNLAQQGRRLRAVLEGTRTATWQWNLQTGEVQVDARWAELVGMGDAGVQPVTAASWTARIHPQDQAEREHGLQRHFDGRTETYEAEYRMRHGDGSWHWVRDRGRVTAHLASNGSPTTMLGTYDDITQQKEAELVKSRHDELMRALFELSPLGLALLDLQQGRALALNDSLLAITGYSRDELLDGHASGGRAAAALGLRGRWLQQAAQDGRFGPHEVEFQHRSGHLINLVFNGVRVSNHEQTDYLWLSVADITERHAMERRLRIAASEDTLTGLCNRAALLSALQGEIDRPPVHALKGLSVLFVDLDRFKFVNDALGHAIGDELLRAVARRMREVALHTQAAPWTIARLGGDEFVVVVPDTLHAKAALHAAEQLMQALIAPYSIRHQAVFTSASIGIAMWREGVDAAETLLRDADAAMYEAKHLGLGRCVLFDDSMRNRLTRAVVIEKELRHAVERGELHAVYQPIVDLETGTMSSVEALLRWDHPELGAVSPNEFIPVAEESGHIMALGEWILRTACKQWTAWQQEDAAIAPATISVNLSREQVALGPRVLTMVRDALAEANMPACALQLEITEREVMKNPEQARELLNELSDMGVKLAMDDFGTGTSSLGCLRDYPFDTIKIDKSFVTNLCRDPHVLAVAHATVTVIENLGMVSVAEGIEDPAEVAALQAMGCRYGQGFLFARPVPAHALLAALS